MKGLSAILLCSVLALAAAADNQCPSEQEVNWDIELLLRHEDCDKFYKCTFGQPVEQLCPAGLFFNLDQWECDWKDKVKCGDRNVPGEEKPKPEPEVSEPEVEEVPEQEPEVEEPELEAVPEPKPEVEAVPEPEPEVEAVPEPEPEVEEDISEPEPEVEAVPEPEPEAVEVVPEPKPEVEEEVSEPEPEVEAVPEPEPEVEEEVSEPEPEVEEVPEPEQEEDNVPEQETEFLENGCPVDPHIHWLLPHENDCNQFYYCVWGEKVQRECPSSLHFNRNIQVCDWPWDAGCPVSANKHIEGRRAILSGIQL